MLLTAHTSRAPGTLRALVARIDPHLFPAAGVLVGFCVAAVALLHRLPAPTQAIPPGYVAMVNGEGILMSDFIQQTMDTTSDTFENATPAVRAQVLHDMIDEELLVQEALTLDLPETTTEVRNVMVSAVDTQVAQPLLSIPLTDADLRAYYMAHRSDFLTAGSMNVSDIVLHVGGYENVDQTVAQAETDATEAAYQLRSGADLHYIMNHFGFVNSGRMDGTEQLDFAAKIHLGDKLYAIAQKLDEGQVSDPIVMPDGVHLLIMQKRTPDTFADFDSSRPKIYTDYRDAQRRHADALYMQRLRRGAHITILPGFHE